jgi:hypothetical protein
MSVKVAIRVRPFNERENFLGCICCVDMRDNTTILYENREKNKKQHYFTFDYSIWSHDEFHIGENGYMHPTSNRYIDQQKVYNLIGKEILENAW